MGKAPPSAPPPAAAPVPSEAGCEGLVACEVEATQVVTSTPSLDKLLTRLDSELSVVVEDKPFQYPTPEQSLPRVTEDDIMQRARTEQSLPRLTEDATMHRARTEQSLPSESQGVDASLSTLNEELDREIDRLMMQEDLSLGPAPTVPPLLIEIPDYEPAGQPPTSSPLAPSVLGHARSFHDGTLAARVSQAPFLKTVCVCVFFWAGFCLF